MKNKIRTAKQQSFIMTLFTVIKEIIALPFEKALSLDFNHQYDETIL